ncbi:acyl-coenzyme A thioesterase 1 isoform X2 [Amia ocellicauda]|uniref:acyl-coenzyme A thioesterase 1 isoform X2 n=1 Tax=Amia ocellicauda TaxID=2972642 RepID=UPI003464053A
MPFSSYLRSGFAAGKLGALHFHRAWRRLLSSAVASETMPVRLRVEPDAKCLFDRPVRVKVEGLSPLQPVTLRATLTDERSTVFTSTASYRADRTGMLDLCSAAALGGDYTGVQPMGFLWAMKSRTPNKRLMKRDVTTPYEVHIAVYPGSEAGGAEPGGSPLASCTNERGFLGEGVRRLPVREGRIRATLFLPAGEGPFPGVIDLGGTAGGLLEHRGSLLANHGFATLTLAYFDFEDLPKHLVEFDLEYFEEALRYLQDLPQVRKGGIGVLGVSKGADLALSMASFLDGVAAVVSIAGCNANFQSTLRFKGAELPALMVVIENLKTDPSTGACFFTECYEDPRDPACRAVIPIERAGARFLFVGGEDDCIWNTCMYTREAEKRLVSHGKDRPEILRLPGTGHLVEPPYFPLCQVSFHKPVNMNLVWGGEVEAHAAGQEMAWARVRRFLWENLGGAGCAKSKL